VREDDHNSFEGDKIVGDGAASVFTSALVNGLRSGDADSDHNGLITVNELYEYAYHEVTTGHGRQTPSLWTQGVEGSLIVAHSLKGAVIEPAPLPEDLRVSLESPRPRVREVAVSELADLLAGEHPGLALTAGEELERIATEDVPRVAGAARSALEAHRADAIEPQPEPEPEPAPEPEPTPEPVAKPEATIHQAPQPSEPEAPKPEAPHRTRRRLALPTGPGRALRRSWRKALAWTTPPLSLAAIVLALLVPGGDDKDRGDGTGGSTRSSAGATTGGSGGDESSADEWKSGKNVALRPFNDAEERVDAYLFRPDSSSPVKIGLETHLTRGQRYKLLLFDDVSSVAEFSALPDSVKVIRDTGPGGALATVDVDEDYRYTSMELPRGWREHQNLGIAGVSGGAGDLRLQLPTAKLKPPS
jgi:hypothetical protein